MKQREGHDPRGGIKHRQPDQHQAQPEPRTRDVSNARTASEWRQRGETHQTVAGTDGYIPAAQVLVASNARTLRQDTGTWCHLCPRLLRRGERVADLPGGGVIHVACTALIGPHNDA